MEIISGGNLRKALQMLNEHDGPDRVRAYGGNYTRDPKVVLHWLTYYDGDVDETVAAMIEKEDTDVTYEQMVNHLYTRIANVNSRIDILLKTITVMNDTVAEIVKYMEGHNESMRKIFEEYYEGRTKHEGGKPGD